MTMIDRMTEYVYHAVGSNTSCVWPRTKIQMLHHLVRIQC